MRLKPGFTPDAVEPVLGRALLLWQNLQSNREPWDEYFRVVDNTERVLGQYFIEPDFNAVLYDGHFRTLIRSGPMSRATPRIMTREAEKQIEFLKQVQDDLKLLRTYADRPGVPVVYDTNMLVHWLSPDQVKWTDVLRGEGVRTSEVRLVVPLIVIDELDRQKSGEGQLGERAAQAIRYLQKALEGAEGEPVTVRSGVTLEVRLDPPGHRRGDADMEILLCAAELDQLKPGTETRVLSDDFGMHLRAQGLGLKAMRLPRDCRKDARRPGPASGDQNREGE
ncbi:MULTISPECIES: PIN domain-containing protein [Terrabacteria group]|uniref:PIN domain-containing protein n=1 Tax=Bacillati TaxID=1783272 RepID=UPI0035DAF3AB